MEQFSKIYLLQSEAALFDVRLRIKVANHRFSLSILRKQMTDVSQARKMKPFKMRENRYVLCYGTTRFARDLAKAAQTLRLLRVS
jgi:hypothetical protein